MPYIHPIDRVRLDPWLSEQPGGLAAGQLNYVLTKVIQRYLKDIGILQGSVGYSALNEVVGVLECAKLELYRRRIAPYEDKKKEENGDVYPSG